jgi:UDP-glucose 4-epimerase
MNNILITGGAGFIGSHLANVLCLDHKVHILDDFSYGNEHNLINHPSLIVHRTDILNRSKLSSLFYNYRFDSVFHFAALSNLKVCQEDPLLAELVNYKATLDFYKLCANHKVRHFFFASSAAVYGDSDQVPVNEGSMTRPISIYGKQKLMAETWIRDNDRVDFTYCFRFFNIFGLNQDPSSPYSGVLALFIDQALNSDRPKVKIFGDGHQERDFVYVNDLVRLLHLTLKSRLPSNTFNLGTGHSVNLLEIVNTLENITKKPILRNFCAPVNGDIKISRACTQKLQTYFPDFDFEFDLRSSLEHYIKGKNLQKFQKSS